MTSTNAYNTIDMGLRLAMPRGGTDRPVTGEQR